jgi:two-component system, chemotaxis family, chemotaxis protein CheY
MFILRRRRAEITLFLARIEGVSPDWTLLPCTRGDRVTFHALIVDDSNAVRAFVRASLEDADFARVLEAETGFQALRLLASNKFDVVIVDVNMPDINGLELLAFMSKSPRKILISTQVDGSDAKRGSELGADAFLQKPFDVDDLKNLIRGLPGLAEKVSR